jgi:hypothetical protein
MIYRKSSAKYIAIIHFNYTISSNITQLVVDQCSQLESPFDEEKDSGLKE